MTDRFIIRGNRVVTPTGVRPANVYVIGETIEAVEDAGEPPTDVSVVDVGDHVLMPGVVDAHVHINEPGRTDWEGFETATRSAAAGGTTTLVDMPLNCIPATVTLDALRTKLGASRGKMHVDVGFWGGVVPKNTRDLEPLWRAGVLGFKCFLTPSGVDEFQFVRPEDLDVSMPELARLGAVLLCHAEDPDSLDPALMMGDTRSYAAYLASRPPEAEIEAISTLLDRCRRFGGPLHIVHLSAAGAIDRIRDAKAEGLPVTVETCPHYLVFHADEIPNGATQFKCAPPIRDKANAEALWEALDEGVIDYIATDHSPSPPEFKRLDSGRFDHAWGGIASMQLLLPAVWTEASRRGFGLRELTRWLCEKPAATAGLVGKKGSVAAGHDADFVVWDPDENFIVDPTDLFHRHGLTPYAGRELKGRVISTWLRGSCVYESGDFLDEPAGRAVLLER